MAVPPNEEANFGSEIELALVLTAFEQDASVYVAIPFLGTAFTRNVAAGSSERISSVDAELSWDLEVRAAEAVVNKGIYLQSDVPINARLYSARSFSSDAYTAVPVHAWGRTYRHIGYYEQADENKRRGSGFLIVAAYDNTEITIALQSKVAGRTSSGRDANSSFDISLSRGETYMVHGDGDIDAFDLSGSLIQASKAVGVISFHMRSIVPLAVGGGDRSFLVEMQAPVEQWGRRYVTRAFERTDFGDFFRVMGAEDNTSVSLRTYDPVSGQETQSLDFLLSKAGDFREFGEYAPEASARPEAVRGISYWEADKPIQVVMYSYSSIWDGASGYNPFMISLTPLESASQTEIIDIPSGTGLAVVDIYTESALEDVQSLKLNGQAIELIDNVFLGRTYGGQELRCSRISLAPGVHNISGSAFFVGMVHTIGGNSIHGLPLGRRAFPDLQTGGPQDENPQVRQESVDCFSAQMRVESGSNSVPLAFIRADQPGLANIRVVPADALEIDPAADVRARTFSLEVIDRSRDARVNIEAFDRRGLRAALRFEYLVAQLNSAPPAVLHQNLQTGNQRDNQLIISNQSENNAVQINSVRLLHGDRGVRIVERPSTPTLIEPLQDFQLRIESIAGEVGTVYDTLVVADSCREALLIPIEIGVEQGIDGEAVVVASDFDFGGVRVGTEAQREVPVRNIGTEPLIIDCVTDATSPAFTFVQSGCDIFFPRTLEPAEVLLLDVFFRPQDAVVYSTELVVNSNARGIDSLVSLFGQGLPRVTDVREARRSLSDGLHVYPNPVRAQLTVEFGSNAEAQAAEITCLDVLGRPLALVAGSLDPGADGRRILDTSVLAPGVYILAVRRGQTVETTSFVVSD